MYTREQFAKLIDYTLLKQTATRDDITRFCEEAQKYHFAAAVVFPHWVPLAVKLLEGSDVKVCTTISFPHGASTRSAKIYEARNAVANGADELDVVMNIGALKSGEFDYVLSELTDVISASKLSGLTNESKRTLVKIIIETPLLTRKEKIIASEIVRDAGGDFIKTSTGTAPNGATVEDVQLIRNVVGPTIGIKAAGGIRTVEQALNLLDVGTNRLGTSTGVALVEAYNPDEFLKAARQ